MKINFILILSLVLFLYSVPVYAQVVSQIIPTPTFFETKVGEVSSVNTNDKVLFNVKVEKLNNPQNIAYWKVRSYCEEDMTIQLSASSTSDCGKAIKLNGLKNNAFSFLFDNKTNKLKNFAVKLKAYDINGKWLHTEREGFSWK